MPIFMPSSTNHLATVANASETDAARAVQSNGHCVSTRSGALSTRVGAVSTKTQGKRIEARLLLCCARTQLNETEEARLIAVLREPPADFDWRGLVRLATQHGVLPLVCRHLKNRDDVLVPPFVKQALHEYSSEIAQRNFVLTRELLRVLELLKTNDVAAIPLKGPALAVAAYGNLAMRHFGDLDILVDRQSVGHAKDVLLSDRYHLKTELSRVQEADHLRDDSVYDLMRDDNRVPVELHFAITSNCLPFNLDLKALQAHLEPLSVAGTAVANASPEDTLLILCVHGTKHIWGRLGWTCDVAELLRATPNLDWKRVLKQAGRLHCTRMLFLGLLLAHDLLQARVPKAVLRQARLDRIACNLAMRVRETLFREADPMRVVDDLFILQSMERLPDRVRYGVHLATTPSAEERGKLPDSLSFLWWLIRPLRLAVKYGVRLLNVRPRRQTRPRSTHAAGKGAR